MALAAVVLVAGCSPGDRGGGEEEGRRHEPEEGTTGPAQLAPPSDETRRGSGNPETEARQVGGFSRVVLLASAEVRVRVGGDASVEVIADDNLLDLVTTEVSDDALVIGARGSYSTGTGVRVNVVAPSLDAVTIDGSGDVTAEGVRGTAFEVSMHGAGDLLAAGAVEELHVELAGSGHARLFDLAAGQVDVTLEGSGDVEVSPLRSLDVSLRGSGSVVHAGSPKQVTSDVRGSGKVRRRQEVVVGAAHW